MAPPLLPDCSASGRWPWPRPTDSTLPPRRATGCRTRPSIASALPRNASPTWPRPWKTWPPCPSRSARSFPLPIRPNGLEVQKVRVPLGVIFFIYESRPNVTADAAALCVKAGNAVILRGGKEAVHSNAAIADILAEAAADAGLPADAVQLVGHHRSGRRRPPAANARVHRPVHSRAAARA